MTPPSPVPAAPPPRRVIVTLVILQALALAFFTAGTHGWLTKGGVSPNTTDYASFYAAGRLADEGRPAAAYDRAAHLAAEEAATAKGVNYQYFFNPPPYLLINQPLALLPYIPSFLLFEAATLALWLFLGTRIAGGGGLATLGLLAVPSVWWVLGLGQNSFLNASLMATGMLLLDRRPALAGAAFGTLCYKPHLGLLLPLALAAGRHWRAFAAAGATVALICLLSLALYGLPTWQAFADMVRHSNEAIGSGSVLFAAHVDPSGALRYAGLPWAEARIGGGVIALFVIAAVLWAWALPASAPIRFALLAAGTLIVVPFALFYDLVLASLAAAWLVRQGRQLGFLPGERIILAVCMALNFASGVEVALRMRGGLAAGALVAPLLVGLGMRRALREHSHRAAEKRGHLASGRKI